LISAAEAATIVGVTVAAARLDQQMSQLQARQVMLDRGTNNYLKTVNQLRTGLGLTSQESIGLVTQLNRLNVPFSQQKTSIESYVRLAAVTGDSVQGLAQANTQFMRTMGNTQPVERYSSMVANLSEKYGAGAQSTLDFANQIAPLSKVMGMNAQEITGISAAFSKAGQDGSAAGNVYTKILSDVNRAIQYGSPEVQVYSDMLGKSVEQFKAMPKAEVVTAIFESLNKEGPQAIKTLERLGLEGVRSQRAITAVVQQGGLRQGIADANAGWNDPARFRGASDQALKGMNDQLARAGETTKAFAQGVGQTFLPAANSLAKGFNVLLSPLRVLTDLFNSDSGLAGAVKTLLAFGAGAAVLAPLIPRLLMGLAGASLLPTLARGSLGQGFLLGRNPNMALGANQRSFMEGGGTAGTRTLFRGGMALGGMLNVGGRRGDLSQHRFVDPVTGRVREHRSLPGYAESMVRLGLMTEEDAARSLNREGRAPYTGELTGRAASLAAAGLPVPAGVARDIENARPRERLGTRTINRGIGFAGDMFRAQLNPWTKSYLDKSMEGGPDAVTQESRWRDTKPIASVRRFFSQDALDEQVKATKEHAGNIRSQTKMLTEMTAEQRRVYRESHSIVRNFGKELLMTAGTGARATAGLGYGAARLGATGLMKAGGGLLNLAGGPAGVALAAGLGAYTLNKENRASWEEGIRGREGDQSAGADYRNALGLGEKSLKSFAEVVNQTNAALKTSVSSVGEAITISAEDIARASGRVNLIVDNNIKTMSANQAKIYAGAILPTADPREAQALKLDLIARYGGAEAKNILSAGMEGGTQSNAFGMIANQQQQSWVPKWLGTWQGTQTQATKDAVQMVADTNKTQIAAVEQRSGASGVGQLQQSKMNEFFAAVDDRGRAGGNARGYSLGAMGSQTSKGMYQSMAQTLGLDVNDNASKEAVQRVLDRLRKSDTTGMTDPQRQALIQRLQNEEFANTSIGARRAEMIGMGGQFSGLGYEVKGLSEEKPFLAIQGMGLENLRKTSVGRTATSFTGGGTGSSFNEALANEGNPDIQAHAVRELLDRTMTENQGNWAFINAAMVDFKQNAGAASQQSSQLADALMAAGAAARQFSNNMEGRNTLPQRAQSALTDLADAQNAYRTNPNAPGAYTRVEETRKGVEATLVEGKERMDSLATQIRQAEVQRRQGIEAMDRQQARSLESYYRQAGNAETDFARSRARNTEQFQLSQARAQEDFTRQRRRGEADFFKQRRRGEEDYNHQVVTMANAAAKSVSDVYARINVSRTWSAPNLLSNMADQQRRLDEQQANLARARRAGLSNAAIQQLGLNEAANAQQLERMVQDMIDDPRLAAQMNAAVNKRRKTAGALMKDPANEQWTEMERQRKLGLRRSQEDFNEAMDRQAADFRRSVSRGRRDFSRQMSQAAEDFSIMRERQRKELDISFQQMRTDFRIQQRISKENMSTFAKDISQSWADVYKVIHANTTGETRRQFEEINRIFGIYDKVTKDHNNTLVADVTEPYRALTAAKPFRLTKGGPLMAMGGPESPSDVAHAAALGGPGGASGNPAQADGDTSKKWNPLATMHVNTPYGKRGAWAAGYHTGTDLRGTTGTPIHAVAPGRVVFVGWGGAYGNFTKLDHGKDGAGRNVQSWYAHQSAQNVRRGEVVDGGEQIGKVGYTGRVFPKGPGGSHLHLEIRLNGRDVNPMSWLRGSSGVSGAGGTDVGDPTQMPDWSKMKGVKAHADWLDALGMFDQGWASKKTLPALLSARFAADLEKAGLTPGTSSTPGNLSKGVSGTNQEIGRQMMLRMGWAANQWPSLKALWTGESNWDEHAYNRSSGATGIPQALPGSKMRSAGADWRTNAATQIEWGLGYIKDRYGSPSKAYSTWNNRHPHWYAQGTESAQTGWGVVGENGPELRYFRGGERVRNNTQLMQTVLSSKAHEVVTPSSTVTNNNRYDHSVTYTGEIKVEANDPLDFERKLENRNRLRSLTTPRRSR
jgi:TP901 family phage tail tape measure protein